MGTKYLLIVVALLLATTMTNCYSFKGGTIPDHLKTIYIATVNDVSGFGNPLYKDVLTENLITNFSRDNSYSLADRNADAELITDLVSINEAAVTVTPGELERERRITVTCKVLYYDNINRTEIWTRSFSVYEMYEIAQMQSGRDLAIETALTQIAGDILFAVVSDW